MENTINLKIDFFDFIILNITLRYNKINRKLINCATKYVKYDEVKYKGSREKSARNNAI
jgi:hypothetical protein